MTLFESYPSPIFVCGVARSGTTYIINLLNECPLTYISLEAHLIREGILLHNHLDKSSSDDDFRAFLKKLIQLESRRMNKPLIKGIEHNEDVLLAHWKQHHTFSKLVAEIYALAYQHIHKTSDQPIIWGDKYLRVELTIPIMQQWSQARFLLIYRDPRAVFASEKLYREDHIRVTPRMTAGYWNSHVKRCLKLQADYPENTLSIHYETLVENPQETFSQIAQFIGVQGETTVETALAKLPPKPISLHKWRESLTEKEIENVEALCFQTMKALGYEPEYAREPRNISYVGYLLDQVQLAGSKFWDPRFLLRNHIGLRIKHALSSNAKMDND